MARFSMPTYFTEPKNASSYLNPSKLEDETIKFRILSQPIVGWEEWQNKKPIRHRFDQKPDQPVDDESELKMFTSMIIWNYNTKNIEILSFTQASIRKPLLKYAADPDWGSAFEYDIKLTKEGSGKDTEYTINALPHSELLPQIKQAFMDKPICLDALFEGKDPFDAGANRTPLGIDEPEAIIPTAVAKPSSAKKPKVVIEATPEGEVPDDAVDIEYFMDFMPEHAIRPRVEAFVTLCAAAAKQSPAAFMAKTLDNIDNFVNYYDKWVEKQSTKATA